jgi:ATP-dependent helicase/nuclease subunit A
LGSEAPEGGEYIMIQGAIDLFFEDRNGKIYVVDFKTDRVYRPDGKNILISRHRRQIGYYCRAVGEMLNAPVEAAYIYSFALNEAVPVQY